MIITFSGTKGGTGKTALAANLAWRRALDRVDVPPVDTDEQGTTQAWMLQDRCEAGCKTPTVQCE